MFIHFLRCGGVGVVKEGILVSIRGKLKWLGIKGHDVCNVHSNGSVKQIYTHI